MANLISIVAGIIAFVLGFFCIKYKSQAKKTQNLLSTVIEQSANKLADKAENDMAEKIVVPANAVKSDLKALDAARERIDEVINTPSVAEATENVFTEPAVTNANFHKLPDDIIEIVSRSAERMKGK